MEERLQKIETLLIENRASLENLKGNHFVHLAADLVTLTETVDNLAEKVGAIVTNAAKSDRDIEWLTKYHWLQIAGILTLLGGVLMLFIKQ